MDSQLTLKIGISLVPGCNADLVYRIESCGVTLEEFFSLNMPELIERLGVKVSPQLQNSVRQEALFKARKEVEFIDQHSIRVLFLNDDDYPKLLKEIADPPVILYVLGNANLDASPSIGMVGTRRCTNYGSNFCGAFIKDLAPYFPDAIIISGLAYGIDAASHKAAIDNGLSTIAVMAHGLDRIYPATHRDLAKRIINAGGAIISEYPTGTSPYQRNFLQRNRIVAGLSESTIVVESEVRGGAMSTANYAFSYSREVFAVPGRYTDVSSSGCNTLISRNKAHIFSSVAEFMNVMNWKIPAIDAPAPQKNLFPELDGDLAAVYSILQRTGIPMSIDEIHVQTNLPMPALMTALTDLEFEGIIVKLPGARYDLC